jgi:hypothetical protein
MSSDLGTIFGSGGLVISIISMIYAAINHKRIRAKCCGRSVDFEINIDSTEQKEEKKTMEHETEEKPVPKKKTKVYPDVYHPKSRVWADDDADKELEDVETGTK